MTIPLKRSFLAFVDSNKPMKTFMRAFDMTKEEVERHLRLIPTYRAAVDSFDKIQAIHRNRALSNSEKLSKIKAIQDEYNGKF